jgi:hypothetical protein
MTQPRDWAALLEWCAAAVEPVADAAQSGKLTPAATQILSRLAVLRAAELPAALREDAARFGRVAQRKDNGKLVGCVRRCLMDPSSQEGAVLAILSTIALAFFVGAIELSNAALLHSDKCSATLKSVPTITERSQFLVSSWCIKERVQRDGTRVESSKRGRC